ncbi:hypothetical protein H0H81_002545 [Sphagnurus paluster]|uniref:Uncharacterized protein n=1 Tax=Sphagnurus paluster TaxID=117069 RepID=A0A9P7GMK5_9AGAR|nr:hypothetical protein H0H81_002545 [Sphagnurus paluster]
MSTPACSASLAVRTIGSFVESLNEAWDDFVTDLDAGNNVMDQMPFLALWLDTLASWPAVYSGIWASKDAAWARLLEFVKAKGLEEVYPSLVVAWTNKQWRKLTRCAQLHAKNLEACFEDKVLAGPLRHPNWLPLPPPMDEDGEELLQHENNGPAPADEETDGRLPAKSDDDVEIVDKEPEPKERWGPKLVAQDEDEDDGKQDNNANEDEELAGHPKPCRKRMKKSVPVVEDSDAEVEVPAPATLRELKPCKPKAKGSHQERWAAMSPSDREDLAVMVEPHVAGEFNSAPLNLVEVDGLGIANLSQAALAHWNYAQLTNTLVPCDQCTKGAKPCLVHTGPTSCFLCLKAKAKCSLVPEKPKGKPKGKDKGKAPEEPGVAKPWGNKGKPKKTEGFQEEPETSRGWILGFSERLPSLTKPYVMMSASALAVMAWGAPAVLCTRRARSPHSKRSHLCGCWILASGLTEHRQALA